MGNQKFNVSLKLRDVVSDDLTALSVIKPTEALHRDRIRDADSELREGDNWIIYLRKELYSINESEFSGIAFFS
jgi:hypothetical protein